MGMLGGFIILTSIAYLTVFMDVQSYDGDFAKSRTGQILKTYGGYEYGVLAYEQVLGAVRWVRQNEPDFRKEVFEYAKPYVRLIKDLSLTVYNVSTKAVWSVTSLINEKYPVAENWLVYYLGFCFLPGRLAGVVQGYSLILHMQYLLPPLKVEKNLPVVRDATYNAASTVFSIARNTTSGAADYLQKNIFVGSWSPNNVKKVTSEFYSTTQQYASETYSWLVQSLTSKSPKK